MKKLLIGLALLALGWYLAASAGTNMAGGKGRTIPLGTVRIDYTITGK